MHRWERLTDRWRDLMWRLSGEQGVTLWDGVFGRALNRWHEWGHDRAMRDPRYREIQERIGTPDGGVWLEHDGDTDLWGEQTDLFDRINPLPVYLRFKWWWDRYVGPVPGRQRTLVERGRRGWAKRDVWALDRYLAEVMAGSVRQLAATGHGIPDPLEDDEWLAILDEVARGFEDYIEALDRESHADEETLARLRRSLELLGEYWVHLWD